MGDTIWLKQDRIGCWTGSICAHQTRDTIAAGLSSVNSTGNESAVVEPQFLIYGSQTGTLPAELVYAGGTIVFR